MTKIFTTKNLLSFLVLVTLLTLPLMAVVPTLVNAQQREYTLLEPEVLGQSGEATGDFVQYVQGIYKTFLIVIVFLAVLLFIIGGLEYMLSAAVPTKSAGMRRLYAAVGGLVLALSSYLILNIINPDLTTINLDLARVGENIPSGSSGGGNTGGTGGGGGTGGSGGGGAYTPGAVLTGPIPNTPDCETNPECVSLRDRGATVANYNGIDGPGRTDRVRNEVADATVWVQEDLRNNQNLNTHITAAHTNNVGHSNGSRHYEGIAIDIQPTDASLRTNSNYQKIADSCRSAGFTYVLIESKTNHVHCDAR